MVKKYIEGNWLSRIFMLYSFKVLKLGNQKVFTTEDLFDMEDDQKYFEVLKKYQAFQKTIPSGRSLFWKTIGFVKIKLLIFLTCDMIAKFLGLAVPYVFKILVSELLLSESQSTSRSKSSR